MSNKPIRIRPSSRPPKKSGGCSGCGGRVKRNDPRRRKNARIRKRKDVSQVEKNVGNKKIIKLS